MATKVSKVLVIGSGPIVIGQAAEFDYAGAQACKSLREEGITTVLVNSNPATIMTDEGIADVVYIEPLTVEVIERIIAAERPDGLLPTLGGQTGLNLAVELADAGILDKYNVKLLGTPLETIRKAEERSLFKQLILDIGEPLPESVTVNSVTEAKKFAGKMGLPLIVRPSFTLGGTGGGIARTTGELEQFVSSGLAASMTRQVLVEQCVLGWKEIEYEVMRDAADNCITICNMENMDPMGVHTGDSIVVAPSQTLTDKEYQMLRTASLKIIRALGIEGGCNVQFALSPSAVVAEKWAPDQLDKTPTPQYYIVEVNPRVSRSSALASKATGYPIARVAAKIAIGKRLDEIPNRVTGKTMAAFEPALDYCVVKIPRWPFDKFASGDRTLGSQMKATGEVMSIDRSFEAALQKAVRSLEFGKRSLLWEDRSWKKDGDINSFPLHPNDLRLWALMAALRRGITPVQLAQHTGIDPWFLYKLNNIYQMEGRLLSEPMNPDLMRQAKRLGFADVQIATLADSLPEQVRSIRKNWNIRSVYKMVDTCAAEFDAETPYFYSTYEQENEAFPIESAKAVVIGSGPIRIGQGIEFDYCSVHSAWALQKAGMKSIMINSNPETVSTDFDTSDRLYFEALDEESVRDILENEGLPSPGLPAPPSIVQFGGQTAINLSEPLAHHGLPIIGSSNETIDIAEDRHRFEDFLDNLGVPQPPGAGVTSLKEAINVATFLGYPVLVRPSYVLGGRAMEIVQNEEQLIRYMNQALDMDRQHPILVDKYFEGKECEVDVVCDNKEALIPGIMEHIERAGVHSGDSIAVYPALGLTAHEVNTIVDYATRIGIALHVKGLMNIQFVVMRDQPLGSSSIYVLEVNPRSSRTVPFISKVTGVPLVQIATNVMLGKSLKQQGYKAGLCSEQNIVGIKAPVFSMSKLVGVDTYLGPEMKSTGEVMGIDTTYEAALVKALMAAGLMLPDKGTLLLSIADHDKAESLPIIRDFYAREYKFYATEGTAAMIQQAGMKVNRISKKLSEGRPNIIDLIQEGQVSGVINTMTGERSPLRDGFYIRRAAVEKRIPCFTSLDTARVAVRALAKGSKFYNVKPMSQYVVREK
ncbi:MAG TPA: carbamoyl phosphate synthase large subunit [Dehalococcoidia bacterium]|nr:carbamoyl phosphate synthase large subunit [Dehalococcoidia bacterium]